MIIRNTPGTAYYRQLQILTTTTERVSEPVLSVNDALSNIVQELSYGRDVLIGETHTEISHHLLFAYAVEALKAAKIDFSSALELPIQLEKELSDFIGNNGKSVESILQKVIDIHGSNLITEFDYSMRNITLPTLKLNQVPIIPIDLQPRPSQSITQDEEVNIFMSNAMRRGKIRFTNLPILGFVGARHATKEGIPKHYGHTFCLHAGLNATIYDPTGVNIYEPYDYDCIVELPSNKELATLFRLKIT